jgi:hypothetical protein
MAFDMGPLDRMFGERVDLEVPGSDGQVRRRIVLLLLYPALSTAPEHCDSTFAVEGPQQ